MDFADREVSSAATGGSNLFLQPLDLFADALDLIALRRFFERFAIARDSTVRSAGFLLSIAQMFHNGGIVNGDFHRPFQMLHRLGIIAFLIVNPS